MWSIAPLGNEIRYRVISRLLSRRPAPAASQPRPYAVETDKPPKTHRCSRRSGFTSSGVIPQRWPSKACCHKIQVERPRSEEHTSELQSRPHLVCRLLLEKK